MTRRARYQVADPGWNGYSGISDFTNSAGKHERVIWRLKRSHRRSKGGIKRGRILYLEIRVNDHTTAVWDNGGWRHWAYVMADKTTKAFYKMLVSMYN